MYRLLVLPALLAAAAWGVLFPAVSSADPVGRLAEISVYDATLGRTLPVYERGGRYYIAGTPGNEYRVQINNRSRTDILAVMSVDGVNVLNGADAQWGQTGYVLDAGASYAVSGWRTSQREVAAFYFTTLKDSYAARTGRAANLGVIGIAVFRRKPEPVQEDSWSYGRQAPVAGALQKRMQESDARRDKYTADSVAAAETPAVSAPAPLGTGYGRSQVSPVHSVNFERASSRPDEIITLYYDSYDRLLAQGVIPAPVVARVRPGPDPFPGQFVPPPPQ